jgi:hypothetical protein
MHIIDLQNVRKIYKLLHASAPTFQPQGVSNTKEHKYQYINLEIQCQILKYLKCQIYKM